MGKLFCNLCTAPTDVYEDYLENVKDFVCLYVVMLEEKQVYNMCK